MICSLSELRDKEVINIKTGAKLGYVDDIEINTDNATVIALIVYGRPRFFGLLGRDEDMIIRCKEIEVIGTPPTQHRETFDLRRTSGPPQRWG